MSDGDDRTTNHIFFRPDEVARERIRIPAALFNRCRLLLNRCASEHAVVPVHSMQYQAIIEQHEIFFVDNQAYAVRDGNGGKLIMLAWAFSDNSDRDSLNEPLDIELVYYRPEIRRIHQRLMSEFPKALERAEQIMAEHGCKPQGRKVLPFPA